MLHCLTFVGLKERVNIRLEEVEERGDVNTELEIEGVTASEHEDGHVAGIGNEYEGKRVERCM